MSKKTKAANRIADALERCAKALDRGDGQILALLEREAASIDRIADTLATVAKQQRRSRPKRGTPHEVGDATDPPTTSQTSG